LSSKTITFKYWKNKESLELQDETLYSLHVVEIERTSKRIDLGVDFLMDNG
jgi:hypothetical protein